jgi:hypothetical protein
VDFITDAAGNNRVLRFHSMPLLDNLTDIPSPEHAMKSWSAVLVLMAAIALSSAWIVHSTSRAVADSAPAPAPPPNTSGDADARQLRAELTADRMESDELQRKLDAASPAEASGMVKTFEDFAANFVPAMQSFENDRGKEMAASLNKDNLDRGGRVSIDIVVKLYNVDVVRTDSLIHPIIGILTIKEDVNEKRENNLDFFDNTTTHYTMTFAPADAGKWAPVKILSKTEAESTWNNAPPPADLGQEIEMATSFLDKTMQSMQ